MKRILMIVMLVGVFSIRIYSQDISSLEPDACLIDVFNDNENMFPTGDSITVEGTCDSISILWDLGFGIPIPIYTIVRVDSCNLSMKYANIFPNLPDTEAPEDTIINVCELGIEFPAVSKAQTNFLTGYPNPFTDRIVIHFQLGRLNSKNEPVILKFYNTMGTLVRESTIGRLTDDGLGFYVWDGKDFNGKKVSAGSYKAVLNYGKIRKSFNVTYK